MHLEISCRSLTSSPSAVRVISESIGILGSWRSSQSPSSPVAAASPWGSWISLRVRCDEAERPGHPSWISQCDKKNDTFIPSHITLPSKSAFICHSNCWRRLRQPPLVGTDGDGFPCLQQPPISWTVMLRFREEPNLPVVVSAVHFITNDCGCHLRWWAGQRATSVLVHQRTLSHSGQCGTCTYIDQIKFLFSARAKGSGCGILIGDPYRLYLAITLLDSPRPIQSH